MVTSIKFLFRLVLFWLLFFFFFRIIFLLSQLEKIQSLNFSETIKVFYSGFRLDLAASCYLLTVPFLLLIIQLFIKSGWMKKINVYFHGVLIFTLVGIGLVNITIYKEWGTLINARAVSYATQPKEVFASISTINFAISVLIWMLIFLLFLFLFRKYVNRFFPEPRSGKLAAGVGLLVSLFFIGLGARGGFQLIPINESSAYYSSVPILNQIATNHIWYLGNNLVYSQTTNINPYQYTDNATAKKTVEQLMDSKNDSTLYILNLDSAKAPNIVFIILESWSADVVEALGGEKNLSPEFNKLTNNGILFSNVYSSGFRTDQGLVSLLSGFPAQPNNSIIRHPEKTEKLPSLFREFKNRDYKTSFYYGGEIGFNNMNTYLLNAGCDQLITKEDFKGDDMSNKWGAYDEHVFSKHGGDLKNEKEPFFSVLLTLSTHEPFDIPIKNPFGDDNEPDKFRGAAYYTDQCLGNYFNEIKNQPWFNNTLFILVADHGHRLPKEHAYENPLSRRMTMMFYGNLINPGFKGKVVDQIANQHDLASTLLTQLGMNPETFHWSNNIFNMHRNNFAYISLDYGFSWVTTKGNYVCHFDIKKIDFPGGKENISDNDLENGKSYIQYLYREYLDY